MKGDSCSEENVWLYRIPKGGRPQNVRTHPNAGAAEQGALCWVEMVRWWPYGLGKIFPSDSHVLLIKHDIIILLQGSH